MRDRLITGASRGLGLLRRQRGVPPHLASNPSHILVLKPCCLGDVLMTTPLVAALRQGYPHARITYAVGAWSRPMIAGSQHVDEVLTIPDRWTPGSVLAAARTLRDRRFDVVFVPERTPVSGIVVALAGIPLRVGLDKDGRGFSYTLPVPVPPSVIHEAELYLLLARAVGLPPGERRLWFFPSAQDRLAADRVLAELGESRALVIIHPGGGSNPGMVLERKRWLPRRWAAVADQLSREYGTHTLIVGSGQEADVAGTVRAAMQAPATVLARQWSWGVLGAVIERARLFLGHDTGMSLLANAVGTPNVAVFGPSDPQMYGPYGPSGNAVWRPTPQSPCFYDGAAPEDCACNGQCMRNVEIADVLDQIRKVWKP